jgi:Uncharacterized protein conserved in bacteria
VRFHLPPGVEASAFEDRRGARLVPPTGPAWRFRASGGRVALSESVWLSGPDTPPEPTSQIVVLARAEAYFGRVSWAFTREPRAAQDAPR